MTDQERLDNVEKLFLTIREAIPFGDWVKYGISDDMNAIMDNLRILHGESEKEVNSETVQPTSTLPMTPGSRTKEEVMVMCAKFMSDFCNCSNCEQCPLSKSICNARSECLRYYSPYRWFEGHDRVPDIISDFPIYNPHSSEPPYHVDAATVFTPSSVGTIVDNMTTASTTLPPDIQQLLTQSLYKQHWRLYGDGDSTLPF